MQMSISWSRRTRKRKKGNHRRTEVSADTSCGVIGNTYNTPTLSRGAINKITLCYERQYDAFLFE